jgi:hypothetical protein
VEIVLAGGVARPVAGPFAGPFAGLFAGLLGDRRTTGDCDVLDINREEHWRSLSDAAAEVARSNGLPPVWLNHDCQRYAWCFPLGWKSRTEPVGRLGPSHVRRVARFDLMASKVVSGPKRPQGILDALTMKPTPDELNAIEQHLDRLSAEHLDFPPNSLMDSISPRKGPSHKR